MVELKPVDLVRVKFFKRYLFSIAIAQFWRGDWFWWLEDNQKFYYFNFVSVRFIKFEQGRGIQITVLSLMVMFSWLVGYHYERGE